MAKGELVPILIFPAELGGPDDPHNRSYTTPAAAEARTLLIGTLQRMTGKGLIDSMEVVPDYKGTSIIPSRIAFKAWHSRKKGSFDSTIEVW